MTSIAGWNMDEIHCFFFSFLQFRWIYKINQAEAKKKEAVDNPPATDAQTTANGKQCEMYLQNEGISVIAHMKGLWSEASWW